MSYIDPGITPEPQEEETLNPGEEQQEETLIFGKYKSMEEAEKAFKSAQAEFTKKNMAYSNVSRTLQEAGYQVDEAGNIIGSPQAQETPNYDSAPPETDQNFYEDPRDNEIKELKGSIQSLERMVSGLTQNVFAAAPRTQVAEKVAEEVQAEAQAAFDRVVQMTPVALRTPENLQKAAAMVIGEYALRGQLAPPPEQPRRRSDLLDSLQGAADRPGGEARYAPEVSRDIRALYDKLGLKEKGMGLEDFAKQALSNLEGGVA